MRGKSNIEVGRLMLNPYYRAIIVTRNEAYFSPSFRSAYSFSIVDDKELNILDKLIEILRRPTTFKELCAKLKIKEEDISEVRQFVKKMYEAGVICRFGENLLSMYYKIQYNDFISTLRHKKLTIIGAGPLGSRIIQSLLKMDIGTIFVIDNRKIRDPSVEMKLFPYMDFPKPETSSYIQLLNENFRKNSTNAKKINAQEIELSNKSALKRAVSNSDLIIVSFENYSPLLFHHLNWICLENNLISFFSFIDGCIGVVGPLVIPNETACYVCVERAYEASLLQSAAFITYKEYMREYERNMNYNLLSGIPPLYNVVSGYVVDSILRFLIGDVPQVKDRILFIDFEGLTFDVQDALRNPRCPACSRLRPPHKSYI